MNLLTKIPPSVRQVVYLAYALVGVAFGAISNADSFHDPHWLVVAVGIYAYVGTALGITAHVNVTPAPAKAPVVADTPDPAAVAGAAPEPAAEPAPAETPAATA
jgi:hypothetical protein